MGKCPADGRDLQKMMSLWVVFVVLSSAFFGFALFGLIFELQSYDRAAMATTAIGNLVPGMMAKVNGTIKASSAVVIELRGSGDAHHWVLSPFNLTDPTGSTYVDVTQVQGSTSFWVITRGRHSDDWWDGDAASIIGDVAVFSNGTTYLVARFIARTPSGFAGKGLPPLFSGAAALAAAIPGITGYLRARRRFARHRRNATTYGAKVSGWRACGECGELLLVGMEVCPSCRATVPRISRARESLPTVEFATRFRQLGRAERAATVIFAVVLPLLLAGAFLGTIQAIGLERSLHVAILLLPISAVVFTLVFVSGFVVPQRIKLSPERVVIRRALRAKSILSGEVDRILTIQKGTRQVHMLVTRGDQVLGFGPGLTAAEFEAAKAWIRNLAEALGVRYRENVTLAEALSFFGHRAE